MGFSDIFNNFRYTVKVSCFY